MHTYQVISAQEKRCCKTFLNIFFTKIILKKLNIKVENLIAVVKYQIKRKSGMRSLLSLQGRF